MTAWDKFDFDITYLVNNKTSKIHILTDIENLGRIIDNIIKDGGNDIRVRKREDDDKRTV